MKTICKLLFAFSLGLAIAGCAKYDDTELRGKVDNLTSEVNTLKANQQAMQAVIDVWKAGGYVASIDNSVPGQHTITFYGDNGKTVVIYDGEDGEDGDTFFKDVTSDENGVTFEKQDGTKIFIPFAKAFKLVIENPEAEVEAGANVEFAYKVENANSTTSVDVFAGGNYAAVVDAEASKIVVTAPTPAVNGSVLAWAQNEEGLFSMRKLSFIVKAETTVVTKEEELQAIPAEAGEFVVKVVSNVDIKVAEPEVDWVTVAVTKADYKLTLTLQENTTGAPRETTIKVLRADNGTQVQAIKIAQIATPKVYGPVDSNIKWIALRDEKAYDKANETSPDENILNVTYGETQYEKVDYLKLGTKSAAGKATLKLPKGTVYVSFFGFGWKGADGVLKVNGLEKTFTLAQNDGISSNTWNVSVTDADLHEITLPEPLAEDTDVVINTVSPNYRVVLFGIKASDTAPVKKELTIKTVFAKNSTASEAWNAYYGGTGGTDRNIAMDDEYIYIAESAATAKLWAISVADPNQVKAVNVEGVAGGAHVLTCPRVVKNTDANVNGGKDVLICSNLTRGGVDPKLYIWANGIDNAPKAITLTTWATDNWYGDTFTVWGTLQDGVLLFDKTDTGGNGVVTFILNGVPTSDKMYLVGRAKTVEAFGSHDGVCALYLFPDGAAGVYSPGRGAEKRGQIATLGSSVKSEGGIAVTLSPLDYDEGTNAFVLGYNFIEWEGNRYVIYGNFVSNKKGYVRVRQGALTDEWSKVASTGTRLYRRDLESGGLTAANSAMDITARVIDGELYIAAQMQNVGFGLYKLCYE
ncbi:MAG: BACON domain-containing protein [Bacteroidales bacterium]|nr:BACON domain-containing protein [Bacteroidales bacterium]